MGKPCQFCGTSTELMEIPNIKMAGFFLKPNEPYPICKDCHNPLSEGNLDGLIDILNIKWRKSKERKSNKIINQKEVTQNGNN